MRLKGTYVRMYLEGILSVKEEASIPQVLSLLKLQGLEVVDRDEITRRIVIRLRDNELGFLKALVGKYCNYASLAVKAIIKKKDLERIIQEKLKILARISQAKAKLYISECGNGILKIEYRSRRALLKFCKRTGSVIRSPTDLPPSACLFIIPGEEHVDEAIRQFRDCVNKIVSA
ncbi:MAG: hypothetical protein ABWW69_07350 [Pyrodictiaceae archaeon]